jgi:hypothetical protein
MNIINVNAMWCLDVARWSEVEYSYMYIYIYIHTHTHTHIYIVIRGARWRTTLQAGRLPVRFPMVSLEFFSDIVLPVALWPRGST